MNTTDEKPKAQFFRVGSSIVKEGAVKAMSAVDLKVYLVLALHANWRTGRCWPSYGTIRELTGCSRSSIAGAIRHLVELGAILSGQEKAHNGRRNVYTVFRTLLPSPGGRSSATDDPPADRTRDKTGRFQSSHVDDPRSRTTDDPQSSHVDQNEIYLNESNGTRSKESSPPPPPEGGNGSGPRPPEPPPISPDTIQALIKATSKARVLEMLRQGNYPIPPELLIEVER